MMLPLLTKFRKMKLLNKILLQIFFYLRLHNIIEKIRTLINGYHYTIITYHSFTNEKADPFRINAGIFEEQIKYLKENYNIEPLGNLIKLIKSGKTPKKNYICITIDDGFLDNYEIAYPILKKYNVPATIFITSRLIEETNAVSKQPPAILEQETNPVCKDDPDIYRLPDMPMMSWDQLIEMSDNNIEIGSHTLHHPILTKVPLDVAASEIKLSKKEIEEKTNRKVNLFAFPNGQKGDYDNDCCNLVKEAGYDGACIIEYGTNYFFDDLSRLKRITVSNMSITQFALKVSLVLSAPKEFC